MILNLRRKKKEKNKEISFTPEFASSVVILANPNSGLYELSAKLKDLKETGYEFYTKFRQTPHGFYSLTLNGFLGRLEMGEYTRRDFRNYRDLNKGGVELLEDHIVETFVEDIDNAFSFTQDAGLDMLPLLQRYYGIRR